MARVRPRAIYARMIDFRMEEAEPRPVGPALFKGWRRRCPNCGEGRLFVGYTRAHDHCGHCGEALHHHRADDMPPYLTILIVGHLLVPLVLLVEQIYAPAVWIHFTAWIPLTLLLSLYLLPRLKGAVIGLQWANRMHGFGGEEDGPVEP